MLPSYLEQDYEQRLSGGVVFYDGQPVSLLASHGTITIYSFPGNDLIGNIVPTDKKLDISAPRLGYINIGGRAHYVYRKPLRQYKQSLNANSCAVWTPLRKEATAAIGDIFQTRQFKEMLLGVYPPLSSAIKFVTEKKGRGMAISRSIALVKDSYDLVHVFYKTDEVGVIEDLESRVVRVPSQAMAGIVSKYLHGFDWKIE